MGLSEHFESTIGDSKLQKSEKVFLAETKKELHDFRNTIQAGIIKDFGPKQNVLLDKMQLGDEMNIILTDPLVLDHVISSFIPNHLPSTFVSTKEGGVKTYDTKQELQRLVSSPSIHPLQKKYFILALMLYIANKSFGGKSLQFKAPGGVPMIDISQSIFGISFLEQVKFFQQTQGLSTDLLFGDNSWTKLKNIYYIDIYKTKDVHNVVNESNSQKETQSLEFSQVVGRIHTLQPLISQEEIHRMLQAMQKTGIAINSKNIATILSIRNMEAGYCIDCGKKGSELQSVVNDIESNVDKIKLCLDKRGKKYFDIKLGELKTFAVRGQISERELYQRTQGIKYDVEENMSIEIDGESKGLKDALQSVNGTFIPKNSETSNVAYDNRDFNLLQNPLSFAKTKVTNAAKFVKAKTTDMFHTVGNKVDNVVTTIQTAKDQTFFSAGLLYKGIKKQGNESNFDVMMRMIGSKPSTFGKYQINPEILATKIRQSAIVPGSIEAKFVTPTGVKRDALVRAMCHQAPYDDLSPDDAEYLSLKYFFAKQITSSTSIEYMGLDHNAGDYTCRNAALQDALSTMTGTSLICDGDLTTYDEFGTPIYNTKSETMQALATYIRINNLGDPEMLCQDIAFISKKPDLANHRLYKKIMAGKPLQIKPVFGTKAEKRVAKIYATNTREEYNKLFWLNRK